MSNLIEKRVTSNLKDRRMRILGFTIAMWFVVAFKTVADPFGLVSASDKISGLLISSLLAPFYGEITSSPREVIARKGRDTISVVLYDDQFIDIYNNGQWPIPIRLHRSLLEKVAAAKPRAIFLDIFFTSSTDQRKKELEELYEAIADVECRGNFKDEDCIATPIVLASLLHSDLSDPGKNQTVEKPVAIPNSALTQISEQNHLYRMTDCSARRIDGSCLHQSSSEEGTTTDQYARDTAAYKLYKIWCGESEQGCDPEFKNLLDKTMHIQWGYAPKDGYRAEANNKNFSCQPDSRILRASIESFKLFLSNAFYGFSANNKPACLYHDNFSAKYALRAPLKDLEKELQGKIVLIGTNLDTYPDWIDSHIHNKVPGVFWHSMALDNLIELESNFIQKLDSKKAQKLEIIYATILFVVYAFLSYFEEGALYERLKRAKLNSESELGITPLDQISYARLLSGLLMILLMAVLLCFLWINASYAPENWIGVTALLLLISTQPYSALKYFTDRIAKKWLPEKHAEEPLNLIEKFILPPARFLIRVVVFLSILLLGGLLFFGPIILFSLIHGTATTYLIFYLAYGMAFILLAMEWFKQLKKFSDQ